MQTTSFSRAVVRRKTIYEYHRVSLTKQNITSNTAIYFKALSTCNRKRSCNQCLGDSDSEDLKVFLKTHNAFVNDSTS